MRSAPGSLKYPSISARPLVHVPQRLGDRVEIRLQLHELCVQRLRGVELQPRKIPGWERIGGT